MPSLYEEFCSLHPKVLQINESYCGKNGGWDSQRLYVSPYRKKSIAQGFVRKIKSSRFEIFSDAYMVWGINQESISIMKRALQREKPVFFFEDAFIRSLYNNLSKVKRSLRIGLGFSVDSRAPYYCGDIETDLEILIKKQTLADQDLNNAQRLIRKIVENDLSKYNNQPLAEKVKSSSGKKKILVIGQNYGDMSLTFGGVSDDIFETMIRDAINTGEEVYFKTHPDMIALGQQREFQGKLHVLDKMCNPISLLRQMDEVYVATSQMGFEALMLGKKVTVYGKPFYAGWGLTEDKQQFERRNVKKSLEEIFTAAYLTHPKYVLPGTSQFVSLDVVLNELLRQRQQHFGF